VVVFDLAKMVAQCLASADFVAKHFAAIDDHQGHKKGQQMLITHSGEEDWHIIIK